MLKNRILGRDSGAFFLLHQVLYCEMFGFNILNCSQLCVSSIMFLMVIFKAAALLMKGSSNYINSLTKKRLDKSLPCDVFENEDQVFNIDTTITVNISSFCNIPVSIALFCHKEQLSRSKIKLINNTITVNVVF